MRKILLLVVATISYTAISAQEDHAWLADLFGQEAYQSVLEQALEKLAYYTYADEHGYIVQSAEGKDLSMYPNALEVQPKQPSIPAITVELIQSDDFHPTLYQFKTTMNDTHWYRVGETDYLITVLPLTTVQNKFNEQE